MLSTGMVEKYITAVAQEHFARRREKLGAIGSAEEAAARQAEARGIVAEILGAFPERAPLNVRPIRTLQRDGYSVEVLIYQSLPGVITTANLYRPAGRRAPVPGVVCVPGHYREGKANAEYQRLEQLLARRGIAALVFDLPGQGERLEFYDSTLRRSWLGKSAGDEQTHLGNLLFLTGNHLDCWMLWDAMRGLDVLIEHGEADPARLGATGAGAGGILTRLLCCLEPRLSAAALAADNFEPESLGGEDAEQSLFGAIARGVSAVDLLMPFAPKPLLLAYCSADRPAERMEKVRSELRHWYGLLGSAENLAVFLAEGPSGLGKEIRARAAEHFARAFGLPEELAREPETPPEAAEALYCTETGQVGNSLNAVSVFTYHKQLTRDLPPAQAVPRDAAGAEELQDEIRARFAPYLRLPELAPPQPSTKPLTPGPSPSRGEGSKENGGVVSQIESHASDWGFSVEKGRLVLDERLYLPYSFYTLPEAGASRRAAPTVLALHERGVAGISNQEAWLAAFGAAGFHVMAIDVIGIGETRLQPVQETRMQTREDAEAYDALLCGPESQWARRALNAGLSLFGLRVFSVLRTLVYLRTRWEARADALSIVGVGRGGLWGLYAAALDKDVSRVAMLRSLSTYRCLIEHRRHNHHFSLYLPGCLREFDLPQVAACVAPRPLTLINAVNQRKDRCDAAAVRREYALAGEMYKLRGAAESFKVAHADSAPETLGAVMAAVGLR